MHEPSFSALENMLGYQCAPAITENAVPQEVVDMLKNVGLDQMFDVVVLASLIKQKMEETVGSAVEVEIIPYSAKVAKILVKVPNGSMMTCSHNCIEVCTPPPQ